MLLHQVSKTALIVACIVIAGHVDAGIIKDIFQKVTNTNNKTEETVRESAPICGSGIFSTPNERDLSPEIIFITSQQGKTWSPSGERRRGEGEEVNEIAKEFRFHPENVTLDELERHGFNPNAPVSFLMHGFTSGYPLQAWISAIVEAYTIDRETASGSSMYEDYSSNYNNNHRQYENHQSSYGRNRDHSSRNNRDDDADDGETGSRRRNSSQDRHRPNRDRANQVDHNLFIINWNYAARGIIYPRAVANIPIVASYVTRFINEKLLDEAHVEPRRIQLIGHSLGAHLAGFIGKNTRSKVGRIYGLDPAGPCFGTISGPLYPASKRLAPNDAEEVITIQTNSALLGHEKPLGKYSVYVEGGANQPGCKESGILKSLSSLTWDGGDFDSVSCSHSRAPNLITYRHDQKDSEENCFMVAYACKDWESFTKGQCGICSDRRSREQSSSSSRDKETTRSPMEPVECLRIGLDWQYPNAEGEPGGSHQSSPSQYKPFGAPSHHGSQNNHRNQTSDYGDSTTRRPFASSDDYSTTSSRRPYRDQFSNEDDSYSTRRPYGEGSSNQRRPSRRPNNDTSGRDRDRRATSKPDKSDNRDDDQDYSSSTRRPSNSSSSSSSNATSQNRRRDDDDGKDVEVVRMFLKTSDTQPYCAFHYQLILELNEPFPDKKSPAMSVILQDSQPERERRRGSSGSTGGGSRNSISSDEFGNKFDDTTYTHLLTSYRKLRKIDHGTLIVRDGLKDGHRLLKALHVNYMSSPDPSVNRRLSTRLCPVKTNTDREAISGEGANRFYFKPCASDYKDSY